MEAIKLFMDVGQTLKIVKLTPGQVQLRFSLNSIPVIQKMSEVSPFKHITVDQFISSLSGINGIKVNQILARATIQYDSTIWSQSMWESLCNGNEHSELTKHVTEAINKTSV